MGRETHKLGKVNAAIENIIVSTSPVQVFTRVSDTLLLDGGGARVSIHIRSAVALVTGMIISRLIIPLDITCNRTASPVPGAGIKEKGKREESSIRVVVTRSRVYISLSHSYDIYPSSQSHNIIYIGASIRPTKNTLRQLCYLITSVEPLES